MDKFLSCHGEGAVLADVAGIVFVLHVGYAQDDDALFPVQEEAIAVYGLYGFLLILFHCHQCHLLNAGEAVRGGIARIGGDSPVSLA